MNYKYYVYGFGLYGPIVILPETKMYKHAENCQTLSL